jgi:hypothetical protein
MRIKFRFAPSRRVIQIKKFFCPSSFFLPIDNPNSTRIIMPTRQREGKYSLNRSESHRLVQDGRVDDEIHFIKSFSQV